MELDGRVVIVTGGGGGIGSALTAAAVGEGARVLAVDLDRERIREATAALPGARVIGLDADVADEAGLQRAIETAEREFGPVDIFVANAGVATGVGLGSADEDWGLSIEVNVMAHVRAARLLIPRWLERGGGYFVAMASAAGLLTQIGSAPYTVSKHAAVAFAEWLSVTYGERGIGVSCVCPMGVRTSLLDAGFDAAKPAGSLAARAVKAAGAVLDPEEVARETWRAVAEERLLVLPHPEVLEFMRRKGTDYDRWVAGMRRLQRQVDQASGSRT